MRFVKGLSDISNMKCEYFSFQEYQKSTSFKIKEINLLTSKNSTSKKTFQIKLECPQDL